jgi:hypothetical protein
MIFVTPYMPIIVKITRFIVNVTDPCINMTSNEIKNGCIENIHFI